MTFPFYIARRYLFSKKSTNVINVISGISMLGVAVASMAMVVTLSVFNGFSDLVASLFTSFDPQLAITPKEGKTAPADDPLLAQVKAMPEVEVATESVEDQALAIYRDRQVMVTVKGVQDNFDRLTRIRTILQGEGVSLMPPEGMGLLAGSTFYAIPGIRVAQQLGMSYYYDGPLYIYAPRREGQVDMNDVERSSVVDSLYSPTGGMVFCVQQAKYDKGYILTHIGFARRLFDQQGMLSSLELRLKAGSDFEAVKARITKLCGEKYYVRDRYEQQDETFRIMKIEKLIAYIFLTFILVVACLNIIGSLSMLIIDKRADVETLRALGASDRQISQIFLFEGWLISAIGAVLGIVIGLLLCWMQQQFGIIALGQSEGSFIVNAYPVSVHPWDVILVFVTVMAVSFLSAWYPVHHFSRQLFAQSTDNKIDKNE
jgi:lipoprotein-releasing system permease protein